MARQGKTSESPSKSALKKAKRAAAKAKQDLAKEFATAANIEANTLDLDTVNVIPVQIPRKFDLNSASILATHVVTAQDIPTSTLAPPAIVIIHEQSFSPLSIQTTTKPLRDTLSVLAIRSRLNYESIPIKFA